MSKITDLEAKVADDTAAIAAGLTKINAAVQKLDDAIVALQNSQGTLPPADQAALDNIQSLSASTRAMTEAAVATTEDGVPPTP